MQTNKQTKNKMAPEHIIFKLQKITGKGQILKKPEDKKTLYLLREIPHQPRILYSEKLSFKIEGEIIIRRDIK